MAKLKIAILVIKNDLSLLSGPTVKQRVTKNQKGYNRDIRRQIHSGSYPSKLGNTRWFASFMRQLYSSGTISGLP